MAENVIELVEKLRSYIPSGDGYADEYADTLAAAADALAELAAQRRAWLSESAVAATLVEQEAELQAARDMLDDARTEVDMLRGALGVEVEPHQTLRERTLEAAQDMRQRLATVCELLDDAFDGDAPGGDLYDIQGVNQAHRVAAGGFAPRETVEHPCDL